MTPTGFSTRRLGVSHDDFRETTDRLNNGDNGRHEKAGHWSHNRRSVRWLVSTWTFKPSELASTVLGVEVADGGAQSKKSKVATLRCALDVLAQLGARCSGTTVRASGH